MKKFVHTKGFYPLVLTIIFTILLLLTVPFGCIYGSEGDWFSQHVALAEQFRQIFYKTGRILPDYTPLGSGSNIYDISYYGLLRPDVLLSFLFPDISMKYIISSYAVLEMIAAINLCYIWLKRHVSAPFFAFLGALLFSCGGFTYQAHHQIMFVNYLPFLFLALIGIDRMIEKRKHILLIFSLFLLYLHSFYFSVSALFVCLLYFLYCYSCSGNPWKSRTFLKQFREFCGSVLLSIGMAAVLLLPTGIDLLSNRSGSGNGVTLMELFSGNLSMNSLLYSGYSCGLTLICLYTLFLSIRRKSTRVLGIVLLLCLILNIIPYTLSGFLYIRYKVLIPLVPLLLFLCVHTLEELYEKKIKHNLLLLTCCLIPVFFHSYPKVVILDFFIMSVGFLICYLFQRHAPKASIFCYLLFAVFPILVFLTVNKNETYIASKDNRQELVSKETLADLHLDVNYRFNYLTTPFATVNLTATADMGSTNLYSSVTNRTYADYFYNTVNNPIRIRNRVALMTDANPFFSYLLGIRYVQTKSDYLPIGYEKIFSNADAVIGENKNVLPIAYTSTALMSNDSYQQLTFPYNLMALTNDTIVPKDSVPSGSDFLGEPDTSGGITALEPTWEDTYSFSFKKESSMTIPVDSTYQNKILILSFDVESPKGNEITIDINGTRNKLSGSSAPYPNDNHRFTYILSKADGLKKLKVTYSKGTFSISNIHAFVADPYAIGNSSITPFSADSQVGNAVLKGTATLEKDGYFVTSLPYRSGYQAYVDGTQVAVQNVNEGFVGFPLTKGSHHITLLFAPPGKRVGIFISILSILLFFITFAKEKRNTL